MITIYVTGDRKDVVSVQKILKHVYGSMYNVFVIEGLPEALQDGAKFCKASFLITDKYLDLSTFDSLRCEFTIDFNNKKVYTRRKGCKTGKWITLGIQTERV